jgi:hypothetical protein
MQQDLAGGGVMSATHHTNGVHHEADEAIDQLYSWFPPQLAPAPCPEAVFSMTLKGKLDGQECLLTARGQTVAEFTANVQAIRGLLDPVPQAPAHQSQGQGWCAKHGVQIQEQHKDGRTWYSHRQGGQWCKGR